MGLLLERRCDCRSRGRTHAGVVGTPETPNYAASLSIAQPLPLLKFVLAVQCVHFDGLFLL